MRTNEKKTNAKRNPELHTRNECKNKEEEEEDYVLGRRDSETLEIEKTGEKWPLKTKEEKMPRLIRAEVYGRD